MKACPECGSARTQRRGFRSGKARHCCLDCRKWWEDPVEAPTVQADAEFMPTDEQRRQIEEGDCFVVTSAMNNVPVHADAWRSVRRMADEMGARLVVLPVRYKNPTSRLDPQDDDADVWWPREVEPHLVEGEISVHPLCRILGHVRIQATAAHPLASLEGLTGAASGVVGHAQISMRCIPTPQNALPKLMYTSGSVSQQEGSYSRTKAGVTGEFHHSLGVTVIEKEGGRFHVRNIVGDRAGGFCDLGRYYHPRGSRASELEALVLGDEHALFADPAVKEATFLGERSLVHRYRPKVLVRHDLAAAYSVSHWHERDVLTRFVKARERLTLRHELEHARQYLEETTPPWAENVVVACNHHDHVMRWLNTTEWRHDLENAELYHELWLEVLRSAKFREGFGAESVDPVAAWLAPRLGCRARFLGRDDHLAIKGIIVHLHGDEGPNGVRGSLRNLSKIGAKVIIGHGHTPGIEKGGYQVGTSAGRQQYQRGPGSNLATHCAITENSKRILVHLIEGRHRRD